jgi:hypothetical protein
MSWRRICSGAEAGGSLIEVIVAMGLLVSIAVPMLDVGAVIRGATPYQRQMATTLAIDKIEELGNIAYRTSSNTWPNPPIDSDEVTLGNYIFQRDWVVQQYVPSNGDDYPPEKSQLRRADVTVTCLNCHKSSTPVRVVAVLAKL